MQPESVAPIIFFMVLVLMSTWALFWVIRLAVRYGMTDALRMNQDLLRNNTEARVGDSAQT
ncbi:hypothetical protein [Nocardioides pantholopis]|uniref:hypothetical protein n=1 Tax=Nocardioides pantholopis TaxID=2483798 RepID=UPI000FD736BD|nr:hypothetical protein [Nocardioides pantholopis]